MKKTIPIIAGVLILVLTSKAQEVKINIDGSRIGRTFEGIGALSAGASSKLLLDYPDQYRSQVLDYLFKPKFGASLQHLKVEIGGDVNSTDGSEPSHAHTREEFLNPRPGFFERGYEWMIINEAKKRNPGIFLDCLAWGVPGWIGEGVYFSKDNAEYMASFLKGAKEFNNINFDYVGIWNEHDYDREWIKLLRKTLNEYGLTNVRIIAADFFDWRIAREMAKDKELYDAVYAIGVHYIEKMKLNTTLSVSPDADLARNVSIVYKDYCYNDRLVKSSITTTPEILNLNKSLRNSEAGNWRGDWSGFEHMAKLYNRSYIEGKITNILTWSPVTSYYDNLVIPNSGLMTANTPWSGHYKVEPAIWAAAHTTQFTEPGWTYVDGGCGYMKSGSYVTLFSRDKKDYSIIIETMDTTARQKVSFQLSNEFVNKPLCVWKSTIDKEEFVRLADLKPKNGKFTLELDGKSIYSISTTRGQQKGSYESPPDKPFPFPYKTNFEEDKINKPGKYFMDQAGTFEIRQREDGMGKCLIQVVRQKGIEWQEGIHTTVFTVIGDNKWKNYEVHSDVNIRENTGSAMIAGRITNTQLGKRPPEGYWFKIGPVSWELSAGDKVLKYGGCKFPPFNWHHISMKMNNDSISVLVDNKRIVSVKDSTYRRGQAGLGSDFNYTEFDNFEVRE